MLFRLLLALLVVIAIVRFVRLVQSKPLSQRPRYYVTLLVSLAAAALILLSLTGRVHWIAAVVGAALPFLRRAAPLLLRLVPFLHYQRRARAAAQGSGSGNTSEVKTATLHMVMDHDSGTLHGRVVAGPFAGMALDALTLDDLNQLLDHCRTSDTDGAQLLENYLRHRFGEDWHQGRQSESGGGEMSRKMALEILGLKEGASRQAIVEAHRRLIQKLHPDRGGNDYLASQINRAKAVLLGE